MKSKILKTLSFFVFLFIFCFTFAFSASLELTSIGALDTSGQTYPEWWYMGRTPTLSGTAEAGSEVSIKIGEDTNTVTADGDGNWSYYATALSEEADYDVVISQGEESYAFTLHFGQTMPAAAGSSETATESTVPETGFNSMVGLTFGLGIALLASYLYISGDSGKKLAFEKQMLRED